MRLILVNPDNPVVSPNKAHWYRLNRYRIWKPLGPSCHTATRNQWR